MTGNHLCLIRAFHIDALQQFADRDRDAHSGHVSGHRAITKSNQNVCALLDFLNSPEILLRADRTLNQGDIGVFGGGRRGRGGAGGRGGGARGGGGGRGRRGGRRRGGRRGAGEGRRGAGGGI